MSGATEDQRLFVLDQFRMYSALTFRVAAVRIRLAAGADLTDVIVAETEAMLSSGMTREQLASALTTLMVLAAQGKDLTEPVDDSVALDAVISSVVMSEPQIQVLRGGIRWPAA